MSLRRPGPQTGLAADGGHQVSRNPDLIVKHALDFAGSITRDNSRAFSALILPYTTIDAVRPQFRRSSGGEGHDRDIDAVAHGCLSRLTGFNFVLGHPEQFTVPTAMNLDSIIGRFGKALSALSAAASRCVSKPLDAEAALGSVANLDIPIDEFPARKAGSPPPPPTPQLVAVPDLIGTHVGFDDSFALVNPLQLGIHPRTAVHTGDNRRNEEIVAQEPLPTNKGGPTGVPVNLLLIVSGLGLLW